MKLEIIEGCFGPDVRINENSLFKHEYDDRSDDDVSKLQEILLNELSKIKSNMDMNDWSQIAQIITNRNIDFKYDESNSSDGESCDQCGNYNWHQTYKKEDSNGSINN